MKTVFVLVLSLFAASVANAYDLAKILERPLIAGASMSADWGATSPGKRLAQKYSRDIDTVATPGASSLSIWGELQGSLDGRTAVIALDLFFWDTRRASPSTTVLQALLKKASERNMPVVLGDVPEIFRGQQPGRAAMNEAIRSKCAAYAHCRLFSLDALYRKMNQERGMTIDGRFYGRDELLPDGIHPGDVASREIANRLGALLRR